MYNTSRCFPIYFRSECLNEVATRYNSGVDTSREGVRDWPYDRPATWFIRNAKVPMPEPARAAGTMRPRSKQGSIRPLL